MQVKIIRCNAVRVVRRGSAVSHRKRILWTEDGQFMIMQFLPSTDHSNKLPVNQRANEPLAD